MIFALIICLLGLVEPLMSSAATPPTGLLCDLLEHPEQTVIPNASPCFGWIYQPSFRNDVQSAYHLIVASNQEMANKGIGDVWDSGWVTNANSINVRYGGAPLAMGKRFFWRVQTSDSTSQTSRFSAVQRFGTGPATNDFAGRYPLRFVAAPPMLITNTAPGRWFIDFGQDAFGYATARLNQGSGSSEVKVRFGEMASHFEVRTPPAGSMVRYAENTVVLSGGKGSYDLRPPDCVYPPGGINPPDAYGLVIPFRYLELMNVRGSLTKTDFAQMRLLSEFNTNAASFSSSSPALNQIWSLCRNSMQMLTFDGVYVDGDRERKPYESDTYIHQLSSYAVDREFALPRHSIEYLVQHPTWPTEWKFHVIFMAWADYLQTGDAGLLKRYYPELQADSFAGATPAGSLMRGFPNFPQRTNSDVVDWPAADRDGFVLGKGRDLNWTNSVNNAFYYRSLQLMANIAAAIGHDDEAGVYSNRAAQVFTAYNSTFWNPAGRYYTDGVGVDHASAHANFFPLAFGLVPPERKAEVVAFLHSRMAANGGMPCSVYGAQYLLEGLFSAGDADTALGLMTTNSPRSWLNMLNLGSTLTTEAWNFADKPNMDWNHAWGAAPGNIISGYLLGLQPIAPGFGQILIQPHVGTTLTYAEGVVPTIRGPVSICASNSSGQFELRLNIPGNVTATVMLPSLGMTNPVALVDGEAVSAANSNDWLIVNHVGAGSHLLRVTPNRTSASVVVYANRLASSSSTNAENPGVTAGAARSGVGEHQ
jgi:alpha-L-rhamnosidase